MKSSSHIQAKLFPTWRDLTILNTEYNALQSKKEPLWSFLTKDKVITPAVQK
jgi:hypothetical protein